MSGPLLTVLYHGASLAVGTPERDAVLSCCAREWRLPARRVAPAVPTTVPSLIILGTDAVLAAGPATAVQLAHACLAAGYHAAIPASWGDELIAARVLERLRDADGPVVQCSCPYVARRLSAHGDTIGTMLVCCVSPPVAVASYLRAAYAPSRPRITYAGGCPAAAHQSIDIWLSVDELLTSFSERGISATAQPTEFDSVLPPDRRRYFSEPGGVPARHALRQLPASAELVELKGGDLVVEIAQQLLAGARALVDVSLPLGCCCSGVTGAMTADAARARVRESEPPRALAPVVDHTAKLGLDDVLPDPPVTAARDIPEQPDTEHASVSRTTLSTSTTALPGSAARTSTPPEGGDPSPVAVEAASRRRSPTGLPRPVLGSMPVSRADAGRRLPRAYVARRRSSPRGVRTSAVKEASSASVPAPRGTPWVLVAAIGVAIGLALGWLLYALL